MRGKCKFCQFEKESKCSKKKGIVVKLNKRRACSLFVMDEQKAEEFLERKAVTSKPKVLDIPSWYWIRDIRRAVAADIQEPDLDMSQFKSTASPKPVGNHPLTGDLSRFVSTAQPIEESNEQKSE